MIGNISEETFESRRGIPKDAAALAEFAKRTFVETFGAANRPDDMAAHVASAFGLTQQSRELSDPACITILFSESGRLAAYAQLRQHSPPPCVTGEAPIELWRFYVDRAWHGRGLSHRLMAEAKQAVVERGGKTIWLGVWEHNPRAISFYEKCGFRDVGAVDFWLASDQQTDRIMVSELSTE